MRKDLRPDIAQIMCEHLEVGGLSDIHFRDSVAGLEPVCLHGFFSGWPNPPSPETLLKIMRGSDHIVLALEQSNDEVVGFVTALSDGVLSVYIPLLEVRPEYRGRGIGTRLMELILKRLENLYMVDLTCDPKLEKFYARQGMSPKSGMAIRNYDRQMGEGPSVG